MSGFSNSGGPNWVCEDFRTASLESVSLPVPGEERPRSRTPPLRTSGGLVNDSKLVNALESSRSAFSRKWTEWKDYVIQRDLPVSSPMYCRPGEERYPSYRCAYSSLCIGECPLPGPLITAPLHATARCVAVMGPDDGVMECIMDLNRREELLKSQRPSRFSAITRDQESSTSPTGSDGELTAEEAKKKLSLLQALRKRIRRNAASYPPPGTDFCFYGQSTDTYAFDHMKGEKPGSPNADAFYAQAFGNVVSFAVADGIGWGMNSRRAAQSALLGFRNSVSEFFAKRTGLRVDTPMMLHACEAALHAAQQSVYCNSESKTTFCGGILLPLAFHEGLHLPPPPTSSDSDLTDFVHLGGTSAHTKEWVFVGCSVGDSLIYRYSSSRAEVMELTVCDRSGGVRDAGGALGGSEPDFRNLTFHLCLAQEGDLFLAMSDGVHDNLDPEVMQWSLKASEMDTDEHSDWHDLPADLKNEKKRRFKELRLLEIIESCDEHTPENVTSAVISKIEDLTAEHRKAYENGSLLQRNWDLLGVEERDAMNRSVQETLKRPKGKFDHVTCLCVQVGSPRR